jgi:hypothetical protein
MSISAKAREAIDMFDELLHLAMVGYAAYRVKAGGLNYMGDPIPFWDDLPANIKANWLTATQQIIIEYGKLHPESNEPNESDESIEPTDTTSA